MDFIPFQRQVSRVGTFNGLALTLLKLTSPGMPDIYQGNELWDFSLVDPDNRRPVDYVRRVAALKVLQESLESGEGHTILIRRLLQNLADGDAKLYMIWRSLQLRREHPELFEQGDYQPLRVEGQHAEHISNIFALLLAITRKISSSRSFHASSSGSVAVLILSGLRFGVTPGFSSLSPVG